MSTQHDYTFWDEVIESYRTPDPTPEPEPEPLTMLEEVELLSK